jgi:hypothetical protein
LTLSDSKSKEAWSRSVASIAASTLIVAGVYPKLREHLGAVVATMKLSTDWYDFKAKLDKNNPRQGKPTQLSFDYASEEAEDTGRGL